MTTNAGVTLSNGLVSVTLDPARGGAFSSLKVADGPELLAAPGDDVVYWEDAGDVYGARFGEARAWESRVPAQIAVLAGGPLVARAQAVFTLGGQPLTKTVTVRADSRLIEVALQIKALPETTAVLYTPTTLDTQTRTDDLGLLAFEHTMDNRPIVPGDITYRRKIFYPFTYWSDVSANGSGLTMITHGLQGLGGAGALNLLLVRHVSQDDANETVIDTDDYTLRYAYLPHSGVVADVQPYFAAYAFNQPLIPVWRSGDLLTVQLPFTDVRQFPVDPAGRTFPEPSSLLAAQGAIVADVFRRGGRVEAFVIDEDPATPVVLNIGGKVVTETGALPILLPVEIK
jgi:hypothetical protein